jgi:hypothetical protein
VASSDGANVLGFFAFLARPNVELDELPLVEGAIAVHLDGRVVDEHVLTLFTGDEAVTLSRLSPLTLRRLSGLFDETMRAREASEPLRAHRFGKRDQARL